ncbi:hypothetical protein JXI42_13135 [bacterium]|nr:hypothetical protein [bacterium]
MYIVPAQCPYDDCKKSLIDKKKTIKGQPSIKINAEYGSKKGVIYLSSIYDDYEIECGDDFKIEEGAIIDLSCPHCGKRFPVIDYCSCGAPQVYAHIIGGGIIKFCTRRGCTKHSVEFKNSKEIQKFYKYNEELRRKGVIK